MAIEKSIFIGCSHGELACPDALQYVRDFCDEWKPKHRVHLGDLWDFSALRNGASPEEKAMGIKYDYNCGMELLEWFRPQILTLGNHDHRIWRAANEHRNGALADMLTSFCADVEDSLRKLRIKVTPWGVDNEAKLPMGGPSLLHGYRSTQNPAKSHYDFWGECITAHGHRADRYDCPKTFEKAFMVGTLGDIKRMTYANGYPNKKLWRQSFLYGMHNTKTGAWEAWPVIRDPETGEWKRHGLI